MIVRVNPAKGKDWLFSLKNNVCPVTELLVLHSQVLLRKVTVRIFSCCICLYLWYFGLTFLIRTSPIYLYLKYCQFTLAERKW